MAPGSTVSGPTLAAGTLRLQDHHTLAPLCLYVPLKEKAGVGQAVGVREKATAIPADVHGKAGKL